MEIFRFKNQVLLLYKFKNHLFMKRFGSLLVVAIFAGVITLTSYKMFFEKTNYTVVTDSSEMPVITTSNKPTSFKGNGINEVDFTIAAENTVNAVVHVKNTTISRGYTSFEDLFLGRTRERAQIGTGSGVIISPDGLIVTNNHVINGAEEISITTNDNRTYTAELIGTDPKTDIAILKIETSEDLPFTTFADSDNVQVGEWVLAVGNPFNLTSTVTAGIISAKSRDLSGRNTQSFLQTDAAVNPGNSGGALVNVNGDLIGINTAISSQTGNYVGYSFAVPSNIARKVVEDILEYGNVQNGILGVTGGALNSGFADELGIAETEGFYISAVEEDSGAEKAGLRDGDIIKKLDNVEISKFSDMKGFLSAKRPNDVVDVTVLRNGETKIIPVKLIKKQNIVVPIIGVLKNAPNKDLRSTGAKQGLKITQLNDYYKDYWKQNGIEEGAIVTAINDQKVSSIEDVDRIIQNSSQYEALRIEIINKNGERERFYFRR